MDLDAGSILVDWEVIKHLGSGGYGDVYKVRRRNEQKEYAMKTEMAHTLDTLLVEAKVLKDLQGQRHFAQLLEDGQTEEYRFMIMELLGPSLEELRTSRGKEYSPSTAINVSLQVVEALSALHTAGWLHRDLKPANISIGLGKRTSSIFLLDFGLAEKIEPAGYGKVGQYEGNGLFAARCTNFEIKFGPKDDYEMALFLAMDLLDSVHGLPGKQQDPFCCFISIGSRA